MATYKKRPDFSGIRGQLYEAKLISLLYLRAVHDDHIEQFQIGANVEDMGQFGDIIFKAKAKGSDKPVGMFIQTRHGENSRSVIKSDLSAYFQSYLEIRQTINPYNLDSFFRGRFEDTEYLFVLYTNAKIDLKTTSKNFVGNDFFAKTNCLIGTGHSVSQLDNQEEQIKLLCGITTKEDMRHLAKRIAKCLKRNLEVWLDDELVLRYHVILAQRVVDVSDIQADGYRIASFRHDFLDTNDDYLTIFKYALFEELGLIRRIDPTELEQVLSEFLNEPTDIVKLSKLIGSGITYHNGQLQLETTNEQIAEKYKLSVKQMFISRLTFEKAVDLAAKEILSNFHFKVPAAFGNKDLTIRGNNAKVESRLSYLVTKICELFKEYKIINKERVVTIDDSLDEGILRLNGGIAGSIGNVFVLDVDPKLMKITDNWEQLGPLAKRLYSKLNEEIPNLLDYKFYFNVNHFPVLSFESNKHTKHLVKTFVDRLIFYCEQDDETELEQTLKLEIMHYQRHQSLKNHFSEKTTDGIYLQYFDYILKWWMQPHSTYYITRESDLFLKSINSIIEAPLMNAIHVLTMCKRNQYNYRFTADAVSSLKLQDHLTTTNIITAENTTLTVIKLLQHSKYKIHYVLDFDNIASLPSDDVNALCEELNRNNDKVIILIYNDLKERENNKYLENKIKEDYLIRIVRVRHMNTIIVTNQTVAEMLMIYCPKGSKVLRDKKLALSDLSEESQTRIVQTATVKIPGVEMKLERFLKGWLEPRSRSCEVTEEVKTDRINLTKRSGLKTRREDMPVKLTTIRTLKDRLK
ncbi:hypothetical protein PYW08_012886 [Mythimna loreyi]|uniref:Uncharacterized protein n=1 Tax=Mythimna loreyi TaxID=667449 RepID=A0ACC2Q1R4_9NEOP|nr:hypothetical protein PYW08_012886 [Mythimna loreyi]